MRFLSFLFLFSLLIINKKAEFKLLVILINFL